MLNSCYKSLRHKRDWQKKGFKQCVNDGPAKEDENDDDDNPT
jgi:hypothetical protein